MKFKLLKSVLLSLILVLSFSTFAFASTTGIQINKEVNGVKASLNFASEKLKPGNNEFVISLLDKNNQPITNSNLKVTADMDRSTDMSGDGMTKNKPMMIDLKKSSKMGEYSGMTDLNAKGKWIIKATFDVQGREKTIDFDFNVQSAGSNFLIIGGFSGVVVLIILIAAISKKRSIKA